MSDDRFDEDLRRVLLEDAPRQVPDSLARRVSAIPATRPASSQRVLNWQRPLLVQLAGAAAVLFLVAIVGLPFVLDAGFGGTGSPSPSASPSAQPTPTATPSESVSPASGACRGSDVRGSILRWEGAAGTRIATVAVTNVSGAVCTLAGTPGLQLVDADDRVLIEAPAGSGAGDFSLQPGAEAETEVGVSNYCGPDAILPVRLVFAVPGDTGGFEALPAADVSSATAVPPCMGGGDATLAMNGWRPGS